MTRRGAILLAALGLVACRRPTQANAHRAVEPPVGSANAIPDAPLSGTLRGAPFVVRDARYIIDQRTGYEHTDIVLSASAAPIACGVVSPAKGASVWLRLEGPGALETKDLRIVDGESPPWSVHYQVFEGEQWVGVADGSAILSLIEPSADGRLSARLAVCFSDDQKSCVSGSFEARGCPSSIDQPVRGGVEAKQ